MHKPSTKKILLTLLFKNDFSFRLKAFLMFMVCGGNVVYIADVTVVSLPPIGATTTADISIFQHTYHNNSTYFSQVLYDFYTS